MERLEGPTVVLVFHANINHSEVGLDVLRRMIEEEEYLRMLSAVTVPIEFSTQGEDISFLNATNPEIIYKLKSNTNISVMSGLYSHALPSFFPGMVKQQLILNNEVMEQNLLRRENPIGCLPGFDVSTPIIPFLKEAGWYGTLILDNVHPVPLLEKTIVKSEDMPLAVVSVEPLRNIYHNFYHGFATAEQFVSALEQKIASSQANFIVFFANFEVPQLSAIDGKSRIDLWEKLFKALSNSHIRFTNFDDPEVRKLISKEAEVIENTRIERREVSKWNHGTYLYDLVESVANKPKLFVDPRILFRLTVSDLWSAIFYWPVYAKLLVKDSRKKIIIKPDKKNRILIFDYFLAKALGHRPPNLKGKDLQWFIKNLEKAHYLDSHLD